MPLYTFYPCKPDGSAPSFEAFDLVSDDAAALFARSLLFEHPCAAWMSVWRDERQVLTLLADPDPRAHRLGHGRASRPACARGRLLLDAQRRASRRRFQRERARRRIR